MSEDFKNETSPNKRTSTTHKCRWNTYGSYRLILWAWMMNESNLVFGAADISHGGLYANSLMHMIGVVFIAIPLVYSEICLAQYTNCGLVTMWDFFPLFRSVGYAMVYILILKTIYMMVLTSWYLKYVFYSALDIPPWMSCDDFQPHNRCMVKKINVSIFQHCLETQNLFTTDCGMKTASNCFFEREIGNLTTSNNWPHCMHSWKMILIVFCLSLILFMLSIKKDRFIQIVVKLQAVYIFAVLLVLVSVSLTKSGTWYSTKISVRWKKYDLRKCVSLLTSGVITLGAGYGIITDISMDVDFRSPAAMTAVGTSLSAVVVEIIYSTVAFNGIKSMSYFHGEEQNIIEMGDSQFFNVFASMSELLSYFQGSIWSFLWFSSIFLCMIINLWIIYLYLLRLLTQNVQFVYKNTKISSLFLTCFLCLLTCPFFCADLTASLKDSTCVLQMFNNLFFSMALYWFYGFKKHSVDIVFMIGIKAGYVLKTIWMLMPVILGIQIYFLLYYYEYLGVFEYPDSYAFETLSFDLNEFIFLLTIGLYFLIIAVGMVFEIIKYWRKDEFKALFYASESFGPSDSILFKSRKLFVPQIMTREFLYRQVRIHGYTRRESEVDGEISHECRHDSTDAKMQWSTLTST